MSREMAIRSTAERGCWVRITRDGVISEALTDAWVRIKKWYE